MSGRAADPPVKSFATPRAFETWLSRNHGKTEGIWLVIAKKGSGIRSVTYAEAVEVALCYGWIDGQGKKLDDERYVQKFTPRRARSPWSQINRKRVLALIEEGRMREPGLREIERAKADGRWEAAYASPSAATVPDDLAKALRRDKKATAAFDCARLAEPLRDPLPGQRREEAGDARAAHRPVRRDAQRGKEALPVVLTYYRRMLRELGIRLVTLAIGFAVMVAVVPGIGKKDWGTVLLAALVYMVLNATLGLILKLLTAPLAIITLGLSLLAVNAVVLAITAWIVDGLSIDNVGAAILGTLWLTAVSFVLELIMRRMNRRARR